MTDKDSMRAAFEITPLELKALDAYGYNWRYVPEGQHIQSNGLVADNILRLRGWGNLTGSGALNLSREEAEQLQDALGTLIAKLPQLVAAYQAAQPVQVSEEDIDKMLAAYNEYADRIGAPHGYIGCLEAALNAINKEK